MGGVRVDVPAVENVGLANALNLLLGHQLHVPVTNLKGLVSRSSESDILAGCVFVRGY